MNNRHGQTQAARLSQWVLEVKAKLAALQPESLGKVGVLMGGFSGEREISLQSGSGVLKALLDSGVNAVSFDPFQEPIETIVNHHFDRVMISLHGRFGEDGTMQGLLEQLGIPYTGSGVMASAMAIDKQTTKQIWLSHGLSTPKYVMLHAHTNWAKVVEELGLPLIVKPAREGSSLGLTKVNQASELAAAYQLAAVMDQDVMAEQCIIGDELTCPVMGEGVFAQALPLIKIVAPAANYDYHNKYFSDDTKYLCPTGLDPLLEEKIQELVVKSYQVLGCSGWGRADVMVDKNTQTPYLLEMNTSPGMTSHSLVPMAAKAAGLSYAELVLWIVMNAKLSNGMNRKGMLEKLVEVDK
jgi:D-alanine-D-alanine ligase